MPNLRKRLPPVSTLIAFEAASRLSSFTLAARELHLTQAAISRLMGMLEADLRCRLFERRQRGVRLTAEGAQLRAVVPSALKEIAEKAEFLRLSATPERQLTVFCDHTFAAASLIPQLGRFYYNFPNIELRLLTSNQPIETVSDPFDVGLQNGGWAPEIYDHEEIAAEDVFPVVSPQLIERHGSDLRRLLDAHVPLLHHIDQPGRDWGSWNFILSGVSSPASHDGRKITFDNYAVLLDAAAAGHGIAEGWQHSVANRILAGTLVALPNHRYTSAFPVTAHFRKHRAIRPQAKRFLAWLKGALATADVPKS